MNSWVNVESADGSIVVYAYMNAALTIIHSLRISTLLLE